MKTEMHIYLEDRRGRYVEASLYPVPKSIEAKIQHLPCPDRWLYLHRVWVRADRRRIGLGDDALRTVYKVTRLLGVGVVLRVRPFDCKGLTERKLREWYAQHGFRRLGKTDLMLGFYRP